MKTGYQLVIVGMAIFASLFFIPYGVLFDNSIFESIININPNSFEDTLRYELESDFMSKIKQTGDDSAAMTFVLFDKYDPLSGNNNHCGFAHMEEKEYWYFAQTFKDEILDSYITQDVSPFCGEDDKSCYCELREYLYGERVTYEEFFRRHVSETCPITEMPGDAISFDPTKCEWIR